MKKLWESGGFPSQAGWRFPPLCRRGHLAPLPPPGPRRSSPFPAAAGRAARQVRCPSLFHRELLQLDNVAPLFATSSLAPATRPREVPLGDLRLHRRGPGLARPGLPGFLFSGCGGWALLCLQPPRPPTPGSFPGTPSRPRRRAPGGTRPKACGVFSSSPKYPPAGFLSPVHQFGGWFCF